MGGRKIVGILPLPLARQARSRSVRMTRDIRCGFNDGARIETRSRHKRRKRDGRKRSRNMSRYPIVLKDYGIPSYFAAGFRYNEQALVYSGLLVDEKNPRGFGG